MPTVPIIRRKVIGKHVIYERKPKPKGLSKYVVGLDGDGQNMVKDFSRYALAVLWIKAQSPRTVPHIIICVEGGCVQSISSPGPLDYTVLDADVQGDADRIVVIPDLSGENVDYEFYTGNAVVDPNRIAAILNTVNPIKLT